jgi:small subunit ribosomal protein S7
MPRRRVVAKREVIPDPKYGNTTLAKFMNHVMISGKKSVAESIVYGALTLVEERSNRDPIEVFDEALENIAPMVEVKSRRVGGATYQVPCRGSSCPSCRFVDALARRLRPQPW